MEKHEYRAKTEQMLQYMSQKSYKQAADIADGIDWRRVKNVSMLCAVSEIYEYNGEYEKSREILFLAFERAPESRKIVYRLSILALKMKEVQEAEDCFEEFVRIAPKDSNQYILKYKILKSKGAPLGEQIAALKDFKEKEYVEKWAYELALLYHKAGMEEECITECDDMILWFSEGRYVHKALELKKKYRPLTPLQQEKYDAAVYAARQAVDLMDIKEMKEPATSEEPAKKDDKKEDHIKEDDKKEELVSEESVSEEPVPAEEVPVEEVPQKEPVPVEEPAQKESASVQEEFVKKEPVKRQAPTLSIEEMLQEWEERQKENAQLIEAKYKKLEAEKAEKEPELTENADSDKKEDMLPEDIRKLMEELESEAADIANQKAKQDVSVDAVKKPMLGAMFGAVLEPVMEAVRNASDKNAEEEFEAWTGDEPEDTLVNSEETVKNKAAESIPEEVKPVMESVVEIASVSDEELQKVVSHGFEAAVVQSEEAAFVMEEEPGIKMGDTHSMAAAAKAIKNQLAAEEAAKAAALEAVKEEQAQYTSVQEERMTENNNRELSMMRSEKDMLEKSMAAREDVQSRIRPQNPYDTGYIVQGRYDLDAQSHVGLKAGLTEEQKKLFSYFVPVHGMSEQLVEVLQNDKKCRDRYGTSRIGNILIIGRKGSGKTVLAVDVVKAIQKARKLKQGKVGIVTADSLNKKDVTDIFSKLYGGAIIIEKASHLSRRSIEDMCDVMEGQTEELLVVLEDERQPLERMLEQYPQFRKKFTSRLELPVFINDELVTFGQTYAKENGYKIDEMGILALYSRIDMLQQDEYIVTVSDVKEIIDEAIDNSQRANFKKVMKKIFGKNKDEAARIILKEEDFK